MWLAARLLIGVLALCVTGCAPGLRDDSIAPSADATVGAAELDRGPWRAVDVNGLAPVAGSEPTIAFEGPRVEGSDGCNSYAADLTISGLVYRPGELTRTLMGCSSSEVERVANEFVAIIGNEGRIWLDPDGRLLIGREDAFAAFVADR